MSENFDLFGLPVREGRGGRGRPPFEATPEKSNKIRLGLALGWSNERLARAVGCSLATLKRYFRAELKERDDARDMLELERFHLVMKEAHKGNIGAIKEAGRMIERNDLAVSEARMRAAQERAGQGAAKAPEAEKPAKRMGKKEAAQAAAEAAGGAGSLWQDDLTPGFRPN